MSQADPIQRILLIEDQPEAQAVMAALVEQVFPLASWHWARNLAEAVQVGAQDWNLVLVDLRLPDGNGLDWVRRFRGPASPRRHDWVVVSTLYDDDDFVVDALQAGVDGYLLKGDGVAVLADTLLRLLRGEPPISSSVARKVLGLFRGQRVQPAAAPAPDEPALTDKEEQVLRLIGSGLSIKQAAEQLHLSPHTVHSHIKSIYSKLGIRSRAEAATAAGRRGLI